jgi:tetratricopeptide (TPR) repeat protein
MKEIKHYLLLILFSCTINFCIGQSAEKNYQEAIEFIKSKDYVNAIISYTAAITINPYEWHYYQSRSYAFYLTKSFDNALSDINMALKLKPKYENMGCLGARARLLIEMRQYSEAIDDLNYIIEYFPDEFETKYGTSHLYRGKAFLYSGNKEKACIDFNESLIRRMSDAKKFIDEFCK